MATDHHTCMYRDNKSNANSDWQLISPVNKPILQLPLQYSLGLFTFHKPINEAVLYMKLKLKSKQF